MAYIGHSPSTGEDNNFKILDDISSYTLTFDGSSSSVVSTSDETIYSYNHRFVQGQRVTYNNGGGGNITGLTSGTAYFIIKQDHNNIKLATSASNATAGTAINLTAVGTGSSHTLNVAFDGVNTKFKATHTTGQKARITRGAQLVISINGVIQQPHDSSTPSTGFGFDVDGTIILSQAPESSDAFWGHILTNNNVTFDISDNKIDHFTGDGSTSSFTLSKSPPNNENILVTIDGVVQYPNDSAGNIRAYTVAANVISFTSAPGNLTSIEVRHIGFAGATGGSGGVTGFYGRTGNVVLKSTDNITTGNIVAGIVTATNAVITGDLTVNGTTTTLDTDLIGVDKIEVAANNTTVAVAVTQSGSGDILNLFDGSTEVFSVADGGNVDVKAGNVTLEEGRLFVKRTTIPSVDVRNSTNTSYSRVILQQGAAEGGYFQISREGTNSTAGAGANSVELNQSSNHPLTIKTNNTERLRITGAGLVGIGTVTPAYELHVWPDGATTSGQICAQSNGNNTFAELVLKTDGGTGSIWRNSSARTTYGGANSLNIYQSAAAPIVFFTDGNNERLRIDANGDLNLGNNPTNQYGYKLNIQDSQILYAQTASSNGTELKLYLDHSNTIANFGTVSTSHLAFVTANSEKLRIKSDGKVGINTATFTSAQFVVRNSDDANLNTIEAWNDNGNVSSSLSQTSAGDGVIGIHQNAGTITTLLRSNGVSYFNGGNIGIATVNPHSPLDIHGANSNAQIRLTESAYTNTNKYTKIMEYGGTTYFQSRNDSSHGGFVFRGENASSTPEFLRITAGGDLGVGNDSPNCRLAVKDVAEHTAYASVTPSVGDCMVQLYNNPPNETANDHSTIQFGVNGGSHNRVNTISAVAESAGNRKMAFTFCTDEAGSRTEKMRISGDGKVGIGVDNPDEKLDIRDGDIILSSSNAGSNHRTSFIEFTGSYARINSVMGQGSTSSSNYAAGWNITTRNYTGSAFETLTPLTIQANGNIGINDTSPDNQLVVKVAGSSGHSTAKVVSGDASTTMVMQAIQGTEGRLGMGSNHPLAIYAGGLQKLRIDSNGKVMIGTSDTGYAAYGDMLTIYQSNHCGITIRTDSTKWGALWFADSTTGDGRYIGGVDYSHPDDFMRLLTGGTERIRIQGTGTICQLKLFNYANTDASATCEIQANHDIRDSSKIVFGRETADDYSASWASQTSFLAFHTHNGSSGLQEQLRITSNGKFYLNDDSKKEIAPVYHDYVSCTGDAWTKFATVTGNQLSSEIYMTAQDTLNSVVITASFLIKAAHYQDIWIESRSMAYSELKIKVQSNNNQNFDLYMQRTSGSTASNVEVSIFPRNQETVVFNSTVTHTGQVLEHTTAAGALRITGAGGVGANIEIAGNLNKGSGSFKIPHPLTSKKDTHNLVHSFLEGPQMDLIYRGKIDLVGGTATVNIDTKAGMTEGTFVALNRDVQCFTSNETGWGAVKGSVSGNILTITAQDNSSTDTISWMVVGERQDDTIKKSIITDDDGNLLVEPLIFEEPDNSSKAEYYPTS